MSDASSRQFLFAHMRLPSGNWQALSDRLAPLLSTWSEARVMEVYMGLFGVRNQDVFVLISLSAATDAAAGLRS